MTAYRIAATINESLAKRADLMRGRGKSERLTELVMKGLEFENYYEGRKRNQDALIGIPSLVSPLW